MPVFSKPVVTLTELLWALIGLLLTIGANFLQAAIVDLPWTWSLTDVPAHFLGVSYQIGAVLLIGCVGGPNAAVIAQIAYLALGLGGFPIFSQGGGWSYVQEPTFGYLLGFVPGAWLCGYLAFRAVPKLEWLALCCLSGLMVIHLTGLLYLLAIQTIHRGLMHTLSGVSAMTLYSGQLLPGQLAVTCAVCVLAYLWRRLMFY